MAIYSQLLHVSTYLRIWKETKSTKSGNSRRFKQTLWRWWSSVQTKSGRRVQAKAFHRNGPEILTSVLRVFRYGDRCNIVTLLSFEQGALTSEMYNQMSSLRKQKQGLYHLVLFQSSNMIAEKERQKLLSWLSSLQPESRHEDVKAKRSEGTGAWFLGDSIFTTWSTFEGIQKYHALLSFGSPGAGKTTLLCVIIRYSHQAWQCW